MAADNTTGLENRISAESIAKLSIKETKIKTKSYNYCTPSIILENEILYIKGRSLPENSIGFYDPIIDQVRKSASEGKIAIIDVSLGYFNTSSSNRFLELFRAFGEGAREYYSKDSRKQPTINWNYEKDDDDMQENGEDYMNILREVYHIYIPFKFVEKE